MGFIFAESSRKVEPEIVGDFGANLAGHVKKVGVFANQTEQEVIKSAEIAGLDYIQLHGNESASFARRMPLPVIKAFAIHSENDLEHLHEYPADYLLVDLPKSASGKGLTLDWDMIRKSGSATGEGNSSRWADSGKCRKKRLMPFHHSQLT
ncbi:phosphoribosylanthranilate isomerase [Peribacillus frigoritolerans]|nr:phosphoribosylanthranilate isomerase [Peribacillus frigoritolerans]